MFAKRLLLVVGLCCLVGYTGSERRLPLEITSIFRVNDWVSGRLIVPDTRVGRAATIDEWEAPAILAMDTEAGQCGIWHLLLILPAPTQVHHLGTTFPLQLQVDDAPVRDGLMRVTSKANSTRLRLALTEPNIDQALMVELRNGARLRLALVGGASGDLPRATFVFSLDGAASTLDRAFRICSGATEAEPYFPPDF